MFGTKPVITIHSGLPVTLRSGHPATILQLPCLLLLAGLPIQPTANTATFTAGRISLRDVFIYVRCIYKPATTVFNGRICNINREHDAQGRVQRAGEGQQPPFQV
ncbi:hypothetical protein HELRODRAFT_172401 [Helobdella robusta]|uniref:Uncharacterized protein n=1 Tax=Helobdella robusta TaxID=6412 RepID=T1F599_HELRO|nr:hypothetical protein HELRODRAFT_172401 [Helobdella robusta]ESO04726.1 hypothetical protein HELRODRAFT_172401 [Helobdella robusta]